MTQRLKSWDEIVRLKDQEGRSFQQIAELLEKSKGSVAKAYYRAKQVKEDPKALHPESKSRLTQSETRALKEMAKWWENQTQEAEGPPAAHQLPTYPPATHPGKEGAPEGGKEDELHTSYPPTHHRPTIGPRKRRHLWIDEDLWGKTRKKAKEEGVSVGIFVNWALRAYLEDH